MLGWQDARIALLATRPLSAHATENELDQLIAGCGQRTATYLQILKETGAWCGEVWSLRWTEIDFQNGIIAGTPKKGKRCARAAYSIIRLMMVDSRSRDKQ